LRKEIAWKKEYLVNERTKKREHQRATLTGYVGGLKRSLTKLEEEQRALAGAQKRLAESSTAMSYADNSSTKATNTSNASNYNTNANNVPNGDANNTNANTTNASSLPASSPLPSPEAVLPSPLELDAIRKILRRRAREKEMILKIHNLSPETQKKLAFLDKNKRNKWTDMGRMSGVQSEVAERWKAGDELESDSRITEMIRN
jgi:hypothetical protein